METGPVAPSGVSELLNAGPDERERKLFRNISIRLSSQAFQYPENSKINPIRH
jgi:hypothetical protein